MIVVGDSIFAGHKGEFLCHVRHKINGNEWLEFYGGKPGRLTVRAVGIEQLRRR